MFLWSTVRTQSTRSYGPREGPAVLPTHTHSVLAVITIPEGVLVGISQRDLHLHTETRMKSVGSHYLTCVL